MLPARFVLDPDSPVVCTAIHSGHELSDIVRSNIGIDESTRFREEDPFTDLLISGTRNRIVTRYSRFEYDLNRPREKAVYLEPDDAWGLPVRKSPPSIEMLSSSLRKYDDFYLKFAAYISRLLEEHTLLTVFDVHSYNHLRLGPETDPDDPELNPEIILGTLDKWDNWPQLYERIERDFKSGTFQGRGLDVRFDVKFSGGHLHRWLNERFPGRICCVSVEFKKIFMDEWTGILDHDAFTDLKRILEMVVLNMEKHLTGK